MVGASCLTPRSLRGSASLTDSRLRFIQGGDTTDESEILALLGTTIEIRLPGKTPHWRHQLLALALVDLVGRMFTRIRVVCDESAAAHERLPPGAPLLIERLECVRRHALTPPAPPQTPDIIVHVGQGQDPADVYVDGCGWLSYVGTTPSRLGDDEGLAIAVGPLVAACRAASQVFQIALRDRLAWTPRLIESNYASSLTYESSTDPLADVDMPAPATIDALLVGAGSIGGAVAYLFAHTPHLSGTLEVVDPETLETHNPDRALLATSALAAAKAVKAEAAAAALAHHKELNATPHRERLAGLVAEWPRERTLPLVLSAVDSVESRREIQDSLPLDVIDAACSPSQVSVSGHQTDNGPCVYCLHIENVLAADTIRKRLLMRATGFNEKLVIALLLGGAPLADQHLRAIETHRGLPARSLDRFLGETLETLYTEALLYGEARIKTASGAEGAVAAPFTTALAGFLLAAEALKAGSDAYSAYRLGPWGSIATQYLESLWASPADAFRANPPRWPTHECLCRNGRRLSLLRERYKLL